MEMDIIRKIEAHVSELEARFKKNGEFVANAKSSIEKLTSEKLSITDETNRISGAIEAFKFVLSENANAQTPQNVEVLPASEA